MRGGVGEDVVAGDVILADGPRVDERLHYQRKERRSWDPVAHPNAVKGVAPFPQLGVRHNLPGTWWVLVADWQPCWD